MAIAMLLSGEAVTEELYRRVTETMFGGFPMREDQTPDGLILHTAGSASGGWYVYDLWESQEHFDRFIANQLGPALEQVVDPNGPRPEPQFFAVDTLVKGGSL
jgi:hypothetical protein